MRRLRKKIEVYKSIQFSALDVGRGPTATLETGSHAMMLLHFSGDEEYSLDVTVDEAEGFAKSLLAAVNEYRGMKKGRR